MTEVVRFNRTVTTKEAIPQTFEAGKEYAMSEGSAARWERRGLAVIVTSDDPPDPAPEKKKRRSKKAARE